MNKKAIFSFRDKNKVRWTVEIEIEEICKEMRSRETLEYFTEKFRVSVVGCGNRYSGQCKDLIVPRTQGQEQLLEFWRKYHDNGRSAGTTMQTEYLNGPEYKKDYETFIQVFQKYEKRLRECDFEHCDYSILYKNLNVKEEDRPAVESIINNHMQRNPIGYIIGTKSNIEFNPNDFYTQCFFLACRGLLCDNGYNYGSGWLHEPIPSNIVGIMREICNQIDKEEKELSESFCTLFPNMGDENFVVDEETLEQIELVLDGVDVYHFVAIGKYLGYSFGDLKDDFIRINAEHQLYCVNGNYYHVGFEDVLETIAKNYLYNDEGYAEAWRAAVANQETTDSLWNWLDSILETNGWASILNPWDGSYSEYEIAGKYVCVCKA